MSTFHEYTVDLFWGQVVGSCPVLKTKDQVGTSLPALCGHIVKLPIFVMPIGIIGQTDFFFCQRATMNAEFPVWSKG